MRCEAPSLTAESRRPRGFVVSRLYLFNKSEMEIAVYKVSV